MTKLPLIVAALATAGLLSACMDGRDYAEGSHHHHNGAYGVWYDGHYGAYSGGRWDGDTYMYSDGHGGFVRDDEHHYRHDRFDGAQGYDPR